MNIFDILSKNTLYIIVSPPSFYPEQREKERESCVQCSKSKYVFKHEEKKQKDFLIIEYVSQKRNKTCESKVQKMNKAW